MAEPRPTQVACALLAVACTTTGTAVYPMTPPDVFASTPTIGEFFPTTTAGPVPTRPPEIEMTEILPVDPLTLQPLPGYDPIPMGDWMLGQPSPAGGYLAALVGSTRGTSEVRLVDLANWQVEGSWAWSPESGLLVSDDGTVYLAGSGQFQRLRLGETVPEEVARLPSGFRPWMICPIFVGAFAIFGTRFQSGESASIVSIDMPRVGGREPDSKPSTSHRARSLPDRGRGQPQHVRSIGVLHADTGTFTP